MQITFADSSNTDIDRIVAIADEHMVSHLDGRTLYVSAFRPEEEDEEVVSQDEVSVDADLEAAAPTPFEPLPRADPLPLVAIDSGVVKS